MSEFSGNSHKWCRVNTKQTTKPWMKLTEFECSKCEITFGHSYGLPPFSFEKCLEEAGVPKECPGKYEPADEFGSMTPYYGKPNLGKIQKDQEESNPDFWCPYEHPNVDVLLFRDPSDWFY